MKICGAFVQLHPRPKFDSFPLAERVPLYRISFEVSHATLFLSSAVARGFLESFALAERAAASSSLPHLQLRHTLFSNVQA